MNKSRCTEVRITHVINRISLCVRISRPDPGRFQGHKKYWSLKKPGVKRIVPLFASRQSRPWCKKSRKTEISYHIFENRLQTLV